MSTSRSVTTPPEAELRAALDAALGLLGTVPDGAARVPAFGTDVSGVVGHVAGCLSWYAHDLTAGPAGVDAHTVDPRPDADLRDRLAGLRAWGEVLARTISGSPSGELGYHPDGAADASGFAALGCAELVLHTDDVADALGLAWSPPPGVVDFVLGRVFPDVAAEAVATEVAATDAAGPDAAAVTDRWQLLRWASGRAELPGRETRTSWDYTL